MEHTASSFAQRCVEFGLVESREIDMLWGELGRSDATLEDMKSLLLRKGLLTNFQIDRMLKGERLGYFYGKYKVLYMIGAGTFARVYRSVHVDTGRIAAVKVLRHRHRDQPLQVEQFLREGRMGLKLKHPNIVSITDIQNDSRAPYLVMEFVEGETLRELLKIRKRFEPLDAIKVMIDILTGLEFALTQGVTHRDLKLSNVLVGSNGRCKLVDFGLAAIADTSSPEAVADCPSARAIDYAALERGTGVRKDDERSDLYFAGCMMYQILSGKPPLVETRDRMARLNVSRFGEIDSLASVCPGLPRSVLEIVGKSMEVDPERRYQTPTQMLADLRAAQKSLTDGGGDEGLPKSSVSEVDPLLAMEGNGKTVMLVENKLELQNLIREKLKKRGYRVLVFSSAERAMERFEPGAEPPAHCVVFSAPDLGHDALDAFNQFGIQDHTKDLAAILLVDRKQQQIIRTAKVGKRRMMLAMPLKVRELRSALKRLLVESPANNV